MPRQSYYNMCEVNMQDIILLKQGEIVLKGLNRRSFEQKLMSNIKRRLAAIGKFKVYCMQSTLSPWTKQAIWTRPLRR